MTTVDVLLKTKKKIFYIFPAVDHGVVVDMIHMIQYYLTN